MPKWIRIILPLLFLNLATTTFAAAGKPNHAGIFVGATTNFHAEHTDLTLGAEYEYRFHDFFGGGVLADFVFAKHFETIAAPVLFIHPWRDLKLLIAPGVMLVESKAYFALRGGVGYDFHIGSVSLTPIVDLDLINGHFAFVYGAGFGYSF